MRYPQTLATSAKGQKLPLPSYAETVVVLSSYNLRTDKFRTSFLNLSVLEDGSTQAPDLRHREQHNLAPASRRVPAIVTFSDPDGDSKDDPHPSSPPASLQLSSRDIRI